jgi:cytochrome c553
VIWHLIRIPYTSHYGAENLTKPFIAIYALIVLTTSVYAQNMPPTGPQTLLPWAYALNAPGAEPEQDDGMPKHVPGSKQAFTLSEIQNLYSVPDWHPDDHPEMPDIVAHGREPGVYACAYCHLPNGQGRPENTSLAGLPAEYIVQQMADYKAGLRRSSESQSLPASFMLAIGAAATEPEVEEAAAYFSSITPQRWIRVIETDTVPETTVVGWMYAPVMNGRVEPIGQRIIEVPEDYERTELRDFRSGFIAYVPIGSVDKGKHLVKSGGNGKTQPCAICHGDDLRGLGPVPPLAGRSPSYLVRQLYDLQTGTRKGRWSPLMEAAVAQLSVEDFIAIAAYAASLDP